MCQDFDELMVLEFGSLRAVGCQQSVGVFELWSSRVCEFENVGVVQFENVCEFYMLEIDVVILGSPKLHVVTSN